MKYIILLIVALSYLQVIAQERSFADIGENLSGHSFKNVINYSSKEIHLKDFKGKLLILDFWSTACASCIQSWPKLLDLQREFSSRLQIILVNPWEGEEVVKRVFEKRKKLTGIQVNLPTICRDTSILDLFKVSGLPQVNWINSDGVFFAVTNGGQLVSENIKNILNGIAPELQQKIHPDEFVNVQLDKPLFVNGNGGKVDEVLSQSILTRGGQKIQGSVGITALPPGYMSNITCTNVDIKSMYSWAYSNRESADGVMTLLLDNRISLNVRDTSKYLYKVNGVIQYGNLYNYQFISPGASREALQERMRSDLKSCFGLFVTWRKVKKKCLVVTASDTNLIKYKEGDLVYNLIDGIKVNKMTVQQLINHLEDDTDYHYSPYPIVNETNFKGLLGRLELRVDGYGGDYRSLDVALQQYGMRMILLDRYVDVLEVIERNLDDSQ